MAKFRGKVEDTNKACNLAGGYGFKQSEKMELVSILLTSFVADKFYRSAEDEMDRVAELVESIQDKKFVAKAGIYARNEFGMRSITHVLAGELVNAVKGEEWVKHAVEKMVFRADDMMEILGYWMSKYGSRKIPNSLKKGLALAVHKFDEYQLAKYRGQRKDISLVDLFNLVHPVPCNEAEEELFRKVVKSELKSDTWETNLTEAGKAAKTDEEKKELKANVWKKLILEKKIGYFALLRNLRNIMQQSPEVLSQALGILTDVERITHPKNLVMPFRYITAIEEIQDLAGSRQVIAALSEALDISVSNVPKYEGHTIIVLDGSGSMQGRPFEIGSIFAAALYKSNNADWMIFSDTGYQKYLNFNPTDSVASMVDMAHGINKWRGTDITGAIEAIGRPYERIILLSDMQTWQEYEYGGGWYKKGSGIKANQALESYKAKFGVNPYLYSFDLAGYGSMQFPQDRVFCIAGFSEKIFDVMKLLERDKNALVADIEKIEL